MGNTSSQLAQPETDDTRFSTSSTPATRSSRRKQSRRSKGDRSGATVGQSEVTDTTRQLKRVKLLPNTHMPARHERDHSDSKRDARSTVSLAESEGDVGLSSQISTSRRRLSTETGLAEYPDKQRHNGTLQTSSPESEAEPMDLAMDTEQVRNQEPSSRVTNGRIMNSASTMLDVFCSISTRSDSPASSTSLERKRKPSIVSQEIETTRPRKRLRAGEHDTSTGLSREKQLASVRPPTKASEPKMISIPGPESPGPAVDSIIHQVKSFGGTTTAMASGPFSVEERAVVDSIFQQVLQTQSMTEYELTEAISNWRSAEVTAFKDLLKERLPGRTHVSTRKFCQRHYHNAQRGAWAEEDDQQLRRAYAVHKDKWSKIAESVGRQAEDCRMRWRDNLSRQEVPQGPWTIDEEEQLYEAVDAAKTRLEDEPVMFINWNTVSTILNNTRSAKQCREKFDLLEQRAEQAEKNFRHNPIPNKMKVSKRWIKAGKEAAKLGDGDIYDVLQEVVKSMPGKHYRYADETTFWSVAAMNNPNSRFKPILQRRVLSDLLSKDPGHATRPLAEAAALMANKLKGQAWLESRPMVRLYDQQQST